MKSEEYLLAIKERLIADEIVLEFLIRRERLTVMDGHIRAKLTLKDGSMLEFSEYFQITGTGRVQVVTYSYHWADPDKGLIQRWDNTPHYPSLAGFPHHVHVGETGDVLPGRAVSIFEVLDEIAARLV